MNLNNNAPIEDVESDEILLDEFKTIGDIERACKELHLDSKFQVL